MRLSFETGSAQYLREHLQGVTGPEFRELYDRVERDELLKDVPTKYSFARVINQRLNNRGVDGYEGEIHEELCNRAFPQKPSGILVPWEAWWPAQRDLSVGSATQGGNFVTGAVSPRVINPLLPKICTARLGATILDRLSSNVILPRTITSATAQTRTESQAGDDSTPGGDSISMTPHRVSASAKFSRQLELTASVGVAEYVKAELTRVLSQKIDAMALTGAGSNSETLGILTTQGIGTVTFGGAATWDKVTSFAEQLETANIESARLGFLAAVACRKKWQNIPKFTGGSVEMWESFDMPDPYGDGIVAGNRAAVTNQLTNGKTIFGNWADLFIGMWGDGIDLLVNPFTFDVNAQTRITAHAWCDTAVRYPQSFCASSDSGAV